VLLGDRGTGIALLICFASGFFRDDVDLAAIPFTARVKTHGDRRSRNQRSQPLGAVMHEGEFEGRSKARRRHMARGALAWHDDACCAVF
jgi:hypothetical protein